MSHVVPGSLIRLILVFLLRIVSVFRSCICAASLCLFIPLCINANEHSVNSVDVLESYGNLPLRFETNSGLFGETAQFITRGPNHTFVFTPSTTTLTLHRPAENIDNDAQSVNTDTITMRLRGANKSARFIGERQLPGHVNYLIGKRPDKWHTHIQSYRSIKARNVYPGIDLRFHGDQKKMEYDFILSPGTNAKPIRLVFNGVEGININESGELVLHTSDSELRHKKPVIYQEIDGERITIEGAYKLFEDDSIGFSVAAYNINYDLIIDPIIDYATYLGGESADRGLAITVDDSGSTYIVGITRSITFPMENALKDRLSGNRDMFVAKLNAAGDTLEYATYFGGSGDEGMNWDVENDDGEDEDAGKSIAVDPDGYVYITGTTNSSGDFPITNAIQPEFGGGERDAYLAKLSPDGSSLIYSTFLGGKKADKGLSIALTTNNEPTIAGVTRSSDFPVHNGIQDQKAGKRDGFITQLANDGQTFNFSTFLGGKKADKIKAITLDSDDNIYVTGWTRTKTDFPISPNAVQPNYGGGDRDAFLTKLNTDGQTIDYSTYLGGKKRDVGTAIAVRTTTGQNTTTTQALITGWTKSKNDFPTANAIQPNFGGGDMDAFLSQIDLTNNILNFSTYLGGKKRDKAKGIVIGPDNSIWLTGHTKSNDFPTMDAVQAERANKRDAFIIQLAADGSNLVFSTYFGGSKQDKAQDIATDNINAIYIVGTSRSDNDFPVQNAIQPLFAGGKNDAFIVKLIDDNIVTNQPPQISSTPVTTAFAGEDYNYQVEASDPEGVSLTFGLNIFPVGMQIDAQTGLITWTPDSQGSVNVEVTVSDGVGGIATQAYSIYVPNRAPEIESEPVTNAILNSPYLYKVNADDPDGDTLAYSLNVAPVGMLIESDTGLISWTPDSAGDVNITVQVDDNQGGLDTQTYTLSVSAVVEIVSTPATLTFVDQTYQYELLANDPNGQTLTYTLAVFPDGMSIDNQSGLIEWEPFNAGDFTITAVAENTQGQTAEQTYILTVIDIDEVAIVSDPITEAFEDQDYEYSVSAVSLETDNFSYTLKQAPTGMTINADGLIEWVPNTGGQFTVEVNVDNGEGGQDTQTFVITVKTLEEMDTMFQEMWNGMFSDLITGNKASALSRLSEAARAKYESVFDNLEADISQVVQSFAEPQLLSISTSGIARYVVVNTINGESKYHFVYFTKGIDGIWRLDSM